MRLLQIASSDRWTVLLVCDARGDCLVLDFISSLDDTTRSRLLSDLRQFVPETGVRDWVKTDFSKRLGDTDRIYEFRWPAKKGGTARVLWFYGEAKEIVCAIGVLKKKGKLQRSEIDKAEEYRRAYFKARDAGYLTILVMEVGGVSRDGKIC